jgi:hypothetical protein
MQCTVLTSESKRKRESGKNAGALVNVPSAARTNSPVRSYQCLGSSQTACRRSSTPVAMPSSKWSAAGHALSRRFLQQGPTRYGRQLHVRGTMAFAGVEGRAVTVTNC